MKDKENFWICFWLAVISVTILIGVIVFTAYLYKFEPLSLFSTLFAVDSNVVWVAINSIATIVIGGTTICINSKLSKVQQQIAIENKQHLLYTEPHILIDSFEVIPASYQLTSGKEQIKTIMNFYEPYYTNKEEELDFNNFSLLIISFVNTSEAFLRLRFNEATILKSGKRIAYFNGSSFGIHKDYIMLRRGEAGKIGLVINSALLYQLNHSQITVSTFLDNNFRETYKDSQSYTILDVCEGSVFSMPNDTTKNSFDKVER